MPVAQRTANVIAPPGGVMTDEVGVITGDLTLRSELSGGKVTVHVQYKDAGEWYKVDVNREAIPPAVSPFDPSFSGWYLQGAWTITGERHAWTNANGGFVGIRPAKSFNPSKGTWGAWEIAARYSVLDLNDNEGVFGRTAPAGGIRGGEQKITTVGLNWYPNSVVRFLLDYQRINVDRLNTAGARLDTDVNVISLRSQFAF